MNNNESEKVLRALRGLEGELREVREHLEVMDQRSKWRPVRALTINAVWFALPFACLWSLGLDPGTAAQAAALPWALVLGLGLLVTLATAAGHTALLKSTVKTLELLERVGSKLGGS